MKQQSFFHTLHNTALTIVIALALILSSILVISNYLSYQHKRTELRRDAQALSEALLKRNVQNIKALATAKADNIVPQIKDELFYRVQEAIDIAYEIYERNSLEDNHEEIKKLIRDALRGVRFNRGKGYYFIENFKEKTIYLYPPKPEYEGHTFEVFGPEGAAVSEKFVSLVEAYGDGFHSYDWPKPNDKENLYEKVAFVKRFDPYDWQIGTGLYLDDYYKTVQEKIIKDVETLFTNDKSYILLDEHGELLIGEDIGQGNTGELFVPEEFKQNGDILYYAETIDEFGWTVGARANLGYINQQTASELQKTRRAALTLLTVIFLVTLALIIAFTLFLNRMKFRLKRVFEVFSSTFAQSAGTNEIIPVEKIDYVEMQELCKTANLMINENREIKYGLEEIVDERTRELKDAQEQLLVKEKLATLGQLTATVSHELRNPLGAISNGLFNIETALENNNPEMANKSIELSIKSLDRCVRIIEELLDYGGKKKMEQESVAIDRLIDETLDEILWQAGIKLAKELSAGDTIVTGDREKLRRMLVNLIVNAQQALEEATQSTGRILIATRSERGQLILVVEDNGPGIPEELREKIYEPLFSTKTFGVGLGMTIVRDIVMEHHGEIEFQEPDDGGCRFVIKFPVTKEA